MLDTFNSSTVTSKKMFIKIRHFFDEKFNNTQILSIK